METKAKLQALIKAKGWSQSELARRLGEHRNWVNLRVTGETDIKADELPRIAAALGCQPWDFFDPPASAIPPAFTEAFEHEGAERMLSDYLHLQALTPNESAVVLDLVASLKRHRPELSA